MQRPLALAAWLVAGCASTAAPTPTPTPSAAPVPVPVSAPVAPPVASSPVAAPPATNGTCAADATAADVDADHQPVAISGCPTPMEMVRGNGIKRSSGDPIERTALPRWDLPATLAYACAYSCAPAGAHAAMLGWSTYGDDRPLRNDYAAYLVAEPDAHRWTVVVMWRHDFNKWWNIAGDFHRPRRPIQGFDHAPTAAEIDAVLTSNDWTFVAADALGFKLLAGNMIDDNWPAAPPHHFPDGFEK
jgi:hypothetical protein